MSGPSFQFSASASRCGRGGSGPTIGAEFEIRDNRISIGAPLGRHLEMSVQGQRSNADRTFVVCLLISPALAMSAAQKATIQSEANAIWNFHGVIVKEGWENEDCERLIAVKSDLEARPEDSSPPAALAWVLFVRGRPDSWSSCA